MFHSLKYTVTFPSTGRTLAQDLNFEAGFWAITGPNEVGKSFIFEMLRYLLFGTSALRGAADDYKSLAASGSFSIRGIRYSLDRTMKKAVLSRGDEVVATGVTAVNEKIVQLLGFGLLVFDMANSINQGEVERLGNLTAMERKRMVDSVLGIDVLDVVAKWGSEEARLLDREAEVISRSLVMPVMPEQPEDYVPTAEIDLPALRSAADRYNQLQGYLSVVRTAPLKPVCEVTQTAAELEPLAKAQGELIGAEAQLKVVVDALPTSAPHTAEELDDALDQWDRFNQYQSAQQWLANNPRPTYLAQALMVFEDDYVVLDTIDQRDHLTLRLVGLRTKGSKPCPHCQEDIPHEHDAIVNLEQQLAEVEAKLPKVEIKTPPVPRGQIQSMLAYAQNWDERLWDEKNDITAVERPTIAAEKISIYRSQIDQVARRADLEPKLKAVQEQLKDMPAYQDMYTKRKMYEANLSHYDTTLADFKAWEAEYALKQVEAASLESAPQAYEQAQKLYQICRDYEAASTTFGKAYDAYQAALINLDRIKAESEKYRKVRQMMDILRSLVKQHVLPSLNKVASHLLRGMTGGQRQQVFVDEDFNVIVDNQRLDTLSGSGKACANLALRIALGQVLTNKVMSVLLADEIDASMDDFRAQKTSDVLYTLENTISQVLLVSHKSIDVPNVIELGVVYGKQPDNTGAVA